MCERRYRSFPHAALDDLLYIAIVGRAQRIALDQRFMLIVFCDDHLCMRAKLVLMVGENRHLDTGIVNIIFSLGFQTASGNVQSSRQYIFPAGSFNFISDANPL